MINALTYKETEIVKCLKTPVAITNPSTNNTIRTFGIWDTGATNSVVTKAVATSLGLPIVQYANVTGVHGTKVVPVYHVTITLNNENITLTTLVTECEELSGDNSTGMLIGMNIISFGDLCITNHSNETVLTFRVPSLETVDYVAEIAEHNRILAIYKARSRQGNKKCPCNDKKDFDNCHAKSKYNR